MVIVRLFFSKKLRCHEPIRMLLCFVLCEHGSSTAEEDCGNEGNRKLPPSISCQDGGRVLHTFQQGGFDAQAGSGLMPGFEP